jgi:hypothetical protein
MGRIAANVAKIDQRGLPCRRAQREMSDLVPLDRDTRPSGGIEIVGVVFESNTIIDHILTLG